MKYELKKNREKEFMVQDKDTDIKERSFDFAICIVNFVLSFTKNRPLERMSDQLLRSGTSVGANIEEATGGMSRKEFIHSMNIAKKEARETNYWLRILYHSKLKPLVELDELNRLMQESGELVKILTAIVKTSQQNLR